MILMIPVIYNLDRARVLKLDFRAIAKLEALFKTPMTKWELDSLTFTQVADILTEALRFEKKDITVDEAIDLIENHSNYQDAFLKVFECITSAFGKNEVAVKEKAPRKAKIESGTGD